MIEISKQSIRFQKKVSFYLSILFSFMSSDAASLWSGCSTRSFRSLRYCAAVNSNGLDILCRNCFKFYFLP